jgi:hypothetical protein
MVGGSLRVLRLRPPLKLVAMIAEILLKVALNIKNQSINRFTASEYPFRNLKPFFILMSENIYSKEIIRIQK